MQYAVNPFVAGIYAGDPAELLLSLTFSQLAALEAQHGSLLRGLAKGPRTGRRRTITLRGGVQALLGGGGGLGSALAGLLGAPGRATGGPVTAGRAYTVGERGPELFVPTGSGRIEPIAAASPREVRVAITVNAAAGAAPGVLMQSSRQVARAVRAALADG